jgi:hypothetical protein
VSMCPIHGGEPGMECQGFAHDEHRPIIF